MTETLKDIAETEHIELIERIPDVIEFIIYGWVEIDDRDKDRICRAIFSMPAIALRMEREYPFLIPLYKKCEEFLS